MEYNKLFSTYLKKIREEQDLKLEAVASLTNYSVSYLSELERNKKTISTEAWNEILVKLGKNSFLSNYFSEYFILFSNLEEELLNANESQFTKTYNFLLKFHNLLMDSPLFLDYSLLSFQYYVLTRQLDDASIFYNRICTYNLSLNNNQKFIFETYSVLYYVLSNNNIVAINLSDKIINQDFHYQKYLGVTYYFRAYALLNSYNLFEAFHYIKLAQDEFIKSNNIIRYSYSLEIEASIYSEQRLFDLAGKLYKKASTIITKTLSYKNYLIIQLNQANCLMLQCKYKEALDIDIIKSNENNYIYLYIYIKALCLYHTQPDQCIEYINSLDFDKIEHEFTKSYLEILLLLINDPLSVEFEKKIQNTILKHQSELGNNMKEFLYNLLLAYYREKKNYKKQISVLEALVELRG